LAAATNLDSLPWITKDGYLDMLKVPLESTYGRACGDDPQAVRDALGVLSAAAGHGRSEAAVFLLGFFAALPPEDWTLRADTVEALRYVRTPACASLLLAELDRVKSSNSTRRYLDRILDVLVLFPAELVSERLEALACEQRFSSRMRAKLRACRLEAELHSRRAGLPSAA
jgi:HEAT repeat protein